MRAIETVYKGYRFRSRLEARWAVFFDTLGVKWEYEKEGYDLGNAGWYLPDFWLPQVQMWAEVKPTALAQVEEDKVRALARDGGPVLLLIGTPENKPYGAIEYFSELDDCCIVDNYCIVDYRLTNYKNYPADEGRFYCCPVDYWTDGDVYHEDTEQAVMAARQARFEHGQVGTPSEWGKMTHV